ncbi:hypothetical protein ARSEF1564_006046 [Beauveria bassiana]
MAPPIAQTIGLGKGVPLGSIVEKLNGWGLSHFARSALQDRRTEKSAERLLVRLMPVDLYNKAWPSCLLRKVAPWQLFVLPTKHALAVSA